MDLREFVSGWHTKVVAEQSEPPPHRGLPRWRVGAFAATIISQRVALQPWEIGHVTACHPSKRLGSTQRGRAPMTVADATLGVFTVFNSLRFLAYVPQIAKAIKDQSGAEAISFGTWALFLASHASAMAYAIENQGDWKMASLFLSNALGCAAILLIAAWKRSRHRRRGHDTGE
jgi:hypothetical protein